MSEITYKVKSSAGPELDICLYKAKDPKGLVQILHGMQEHKGRYNNFAKFLQDKGYHVLIHDHLGHGDSINKSHPLGDMVGLEYALKDIKIVKDTVDFEGQYILFGHSMGSFLARIYSCEYELDKLIACGTGQTPNILANLMKFTLKFNKSGKPVNYIHKIMGMKMGSKFENELDWLSYNRDNQKAYEEDSLCGNPFTKTGYQTLFDMTKKINDEDTYKNCKAKKILLISGEDDPVGDFGKGVNKAYEKYKSYGHDIEKILYKNMTHEILLEKDNDIIFEDILEFLSK